MADKVKRTPAKLSKLVEDFDMEIVCRGSDYDQRTVSISDMNRPALQLVGFYDYFEPKRLQVFGKSEMTFLKAMKLEDRRRVFDNLLRCEIPALDHRPEHGDLPRAAGDCPEARPARCCVPS